MIRNFKTSVIITFVLLIMGMSASNPLPPIKTAEKKPITSTHYGSLQRRHTNIHQSGTATCSFTLICESKEGKGNYCIMHSVYPTGYLKRDFRLKTPVGFCSQFNGVRVSLSNNLKCRH